MGKILLSAFSDEYATSFEEQLKAMCELGIDYIELRHVDGKNVSKLSESEAVELKKMLDHYGIKISAIGSPLGKITLDGDMKEHLETARRIFSVANILSTDLIRCFSFYAPSGKKITDMRSEALEALTSLLLVSREYGVTLCHENEANIYGDTPTRCYDIINHFNGEIKAVFDMGNFVLEDIEPYPDGYSLLRDSIAYFHIKDALAEGAIVPPGKGDARIRETIKAHMEYSDKDFFVSLEPHLQTFSGLNALVGRSFENPYKYADEKSAFIDALNKFREIISQ